jgi:hypothetical protein
MMPAVHAPRNADIRVPVEVKLKPRYRYDSSKRVFESASGVRFNPGNDLPRKTRIVYKVPALAGMDVAKLSKWEKDLRRYMQVILPEGASPLDYVEIIRAWPSVEEAWVAPEVSLPKLG